MSFVRGNYCGVRVVASRGQHNRIERRYCRRSKKGAAVSDESVSIDPEVCLQAVGAWRQSYGTVSTSTSISSPDVGEPTATESLNVLAGIVGGLPGAIAVQLDAVGNAITLGAMDAIRADNPCVNWSAPPAAEQ